MTSSEEGCDFLEFWADGVRQNYISGNQGWAQVSCTVSGNGTAPDRMYPRDKINPACMDCHTKNKIDAPQHQAVLTDTTGKQVCTDCHGSHRLPQRRCKWK